MKFRKEIVEKLVLIIGLFFQILTPKEFKIQEDIISIEFVSGIPENVIEGL